MYRRNTNIITRLLNNIGFYYSTGDDTTFIPNVIQPVADISKYGKTQLLYSNVSIASAATYAFFTVPPNEYWTVHLIYAGMTTGDTVVGSIVFQFLDKTRCIDTNESPDTSKWTPNAGTGVIYPKTLVTPAVSIHTDLTYKDIRLAPNTKIALLCTTKTTTSIWSMRILVTREIYD